MPAISQQQQKLFGLALAVKRGDVPASEVSDEIKAIADRMSEKDIEDFAATKHKGLPKMKEQLIKIVREIMREKVISEMEQSVNEGVSVFDERYFGKKGIIIMIDDNGKKVSAIFKDKKNADKYNRNKQSDIEALLKIAKTKPFGKAIDESVTEGKKVFKVNPAIGKTKYSISSHDGVKKHKDGSDFFDIETFKNKVDLEKAIKNYTSKGFKMESINEVGKGSNWAEKYVNDTDLYKKLNWYIMMGKGAEKKIKGKEFVIMSDGSALILNTKTSNWELYKPKRIDKKTGKPIYESVNETKEFPSKEKLVAYMVKGGHNKKDSEKVVDANYEYVKKHYKNAGIPKISDILWTVESVNEGRLSFGDLKKGQVLFNKFRSGRKYTILDVNPKVATVKNLETGNVMQIYSLNNYELKESVNEDIEPQTKKIASLTGTRPDAVKHFVSKHALNITKLLKFIEKGKLSDRMDFTTALAGKDGNPIQKKMIKMFQESVNEDCGCGGSKMNEALKADPRKVYGGTGAKEGMVLVRQDGFKKILDLSKKNPSNVFIVSDDNYTNFGPFYVKNGKVAKYTVANPNYDFERNKVGSVKVPNDVILKFKVVE
jgi:hypothetical protein